MSSRELYASIEFKRTLLASACATVAYRALRRFAGDELALAVGTQVALRVIRYRVGARGAWQGFFDATPSARA